MLKYFLVICVTSYNFHCTEAEEVEAFCSINGRKALHRVSDQFLSISIDPAVLVAGLNLSDKSLLLANHLSPAYIRIAGPSTKHVKYVDREQEKTEPHSQEDANSVIVTPSMWFGINEWLKMAGLTPVYGINDADVWDPESILPLLEISDKLNVSCYWMLGFDSEMNEKQYKEDLGAFQQALETFPQRNDDWKIIGSDASRFPIENPKQFFKDLEDVTTAVMWEPSMVETSFTEDKSVLKMLQPENESSVEIWTTAPSPSEPVSFSSAMLWAEQVGNAAKIGYDAVFRQPSIDEVFTDTPVYWFSLLHKKLMGNNVLETNLLTEHPACAIYAHCTRKPNASEENEGVTVMVVNKNPRISYKIQVKLEEATTEFVEEVQSYILTSSSPNSTDIFLNGKQLTPEALSADEPFKPEHSVTKSTLTLPPTSIGFFVLPKAACIGEESDLEETEDGSDLMEVLPLQSRGAFSDNAALEGLNNKMKKEMQPDEKFSKNNLRLRLDALKQRFRTADSKEDAPRMKLRGKEEEKSKKYAEDVKRRSELKRLMKQTKPVKETECRSQFLDLTSEETERVLKDRARARAVRKNVVLTEDELDFIVEMVRRKFLKPLYKRSVSTENQNNIEAVSDFEVCEESQKRRGGKPKRKRRDVNMKLLDLRSKLEENRQQLEDARSNVVGNAQNIKRNIQDRIRTLKHKNYRFTRDINMNLLRLKTEEEERRREENRLVKTQAKSFFKHRDEKKATIRTPGETSDELLAQLDSESQEEVVAPKTDVFAELARRGESEEAESSMKLKPGLHASIFSNAVPKLRPKLRKNKNEPKEVKESVKVLTASDEFNDIEDDLPCIHEYFGPKNNAEVGKAKTKLKQKDNRKQIVDSMEYLRKRRSQGDDAPELGEVDYYGAEANENEKRYLQQLQEIVEKGCRNNQKGVEIEPVGVDEIVMPVSGSEEEVNSAEDDNDAAPETGVNLKVPKNDNLSILELSEDELEPRRKREEEKSDDNKIERNFPAMQLKQRLSELQQAAALKLQENRLKVIEPEQVKKQSQDLVMKIKERMSSLADRTNKENVLERLQSLRSRLQTPKSKLVASEGVEKNTDEGTENADSTKIKRSLFDQRYDVFGNYKPLTPHLKAWKPSDILSLNRDMNTLTSQVPKLTPITDFQVFNNLISPNQYLNFRRRRSVDNDLSGVDSIMNGIEKDHTYSGNVKDYELKVPKATDNFVKGETDSRLKEEVHENEVVTTTTDKNFGKGVTGSSSNTGNIQKIPGNAEESTDVNTFIGNLAGFFAKIGETLGGYMKNVF
ncbi:hypothetical protein NQ315_011962 [Exocentrus adspersus]|uniref:Heparanase n=1 Tax=Exocentrus adspersus TaxID=1586481 RepID=A0AAV8W2J5_9CUCU|nr:hypothetical protein NQ315_011962 [Exocentrus adspersus]